MTINEMLIYFGLLGIAMLIGLCALWLADAAIQAIQSRILINQLKRTPFVLNNTENQNDQ